ncbi:MAG TPA: endonuclease/exonuclease/phosphatase family protein [Steroidobacteraceae bacterium]|nr:endonuclease/exonuclease/phosphatase family protein [Steroidobacteraceae bacterium]
MSAARSGASTASRGRALPAFAALLALAFAGAQFPGPFSVLDNLSNFPAHFGAAFLACAALFSWRRRFLPALACSALAALALARVLPWYFGAEPVPADTARPWVRLLVSNVYYGNRQHDRLLALVAKEDPDVIGLVEVSARWLRMLKSLRDAYPYHYEVPDEHFVGLALYSRLPIEDARTVTLIAGHSSPAIEATLKTPRGDVELVLAHPMSPIGAEYIERRNAQVAALARRASVVRNPLVLAGDLNLTMWNDAYRPLVEVAQLRNARQGHGIEPSWPALGPVGVPIDHILGSPGVHLRNFRVLPGIGSDHFPVIAEFSAR